MSALVARIDRPLMPVELSDDVVEHLALAGRLAAEVGRAAGGGHAAEVGELLDQHHPGARVMGFYGGEQPGQQHAGFNLGAGYRQVITDPAESATLDRQGVEASP